MMDKRVAPLVLAGLLAASCGWVEWPPPGDRPKAVNRPPSSATSPLFVGAGAVTAGKGDTVYALSRRHRVSMRAIIEANRLSPPYHLRAGQRVILPRGRKYVVRKGDTLSGIARQTGAGMYRLARLNGLKPPYTIRIGQRLAIPGAAAPSTPAGKTAKTAKSAARRKPLAANKTMVPSAVPRPPPNSGKGFLWPLKGRVVSGFGAKAKGLHNDGINIAAPRGTPVKATENGVVVYAGNELRGFGNLLLVKHSGGWISAYAHNQDLLVKRGQRVKKGQAVAKVGSSGTVSEPQLHFELRRGKQAVDPRKHLPKVSA